MSTALQLLLIGETTTSGTHVPLIVSWPGHNTGSITNQFVDFTDFMPLLADITGTTVSGSYGIIDGKSFYSLLQVIIHPANMSSIIFNLFLLRALPSQNGMYRIACTTI